MSSDDIARDVGQVLWVGFAGPEMDAGLERRIAGGEVGAAILFKRNLAFTAGGAPVGELCDLDHLEALVKALHGAAPKDSPLLVAIDQEGGRVARVRAPATQWPPMLQHDGFAEGADAELAEQVGLALGTELAAVGIDVDFAPVLDVHTNDANPIIGDRAFGRDAEAVARRALAFARGLAAAGVLSCGKHFPGHGDTHLDSHLELPRIDHDRARLDAVELPPFRAAAEARVPMIMTAHVVFAAVDASVPATLSKQVIDGILRRELGYDGVIVSDDLDMKAVADHFGIDDAAVRAVEAGCDVLLLCRDEHHQVVARDALIRAGRDDAAFRARLAEAAGRVRAMKKRHAASQRKRPARDVIGAYDHRRLADKLAGRG